MVLETVRQVNKLIKGYVTTFIKDDYILIHEMVKQFEFYYNNVIDI